MVKAQNENCRLPEVAALVGECEEALFSLFTEGVVLHRREEKV